MASFHSNLRQYGPWLSSQDRMAHEPLVKPSVVGLLSRTVLRSPVVNWIIPARVRNREKNDVVFIGEDFLHLKEILPNANLKHVCTKADFGSRIRAARVFGEPRKFIHPPMANDAQTAQGMDWNEVVPPQILVLTLESQELVFLFARPRRDGSIEWKESCVPLSFAESLLDQPGRHLAVDPRSRAVAVGAAQHCIYIYAAKTMPELRTNFSDDSRNWTPLRTERPVEIMGTVLKMEFLYPEPDDENRVILLVVYSNTIQTCMTCYEWDHRKGLGGIRTVFEGLPLLKTQRNPQLLIPLQHGHSFILVGQVDIYIYQDIMTGRPKSSSVSLSNTEAPRYPANSRRLPTWTSWARMGRNWNWSNKQEENFYLVREDGVVHYMQVNSHNGALAASKAGHFKCNVASAFASLDVGYYLDTPDVLVTAGDMSPGEIVKIGQWRDEIPFNGRNGSERTRAEVMEPEFIKAVQNWSPTLDFIITDPFPGAASFGQVRRRLLATSGRNPYGAITEIRAGLNAKVGLAFTHDRLSSVTGLWAIPDALGRGFYVLLAQPMSNMLLHVAADSSVVNAKYHAGNRSVDLEYETLAFATLVNGLSVQITPKGVTVLDTFAKGEALPRKGAWPCPPEESILAAAVCPQLSTAFAVIASQNHVLLDAIHIVLRDEDVKFQTVSSMPLGADPSTSRAASTRMYPTCVEVLVHQGHNLLLVATTDGWIRLYKLGHLGAVEEVLEEHQIWQSTLTQETPHACESAVLLHDGPPHDPATDIAIVCGLRSGELFLIELPSARFQQWFTDAPSDSPDTTGNFVSHSSIRRITLGSTSAAVIKDTEGSPSFAFAKCGAEFYRVKYNTMRHPVDVELTNIWFTDRNHPNLAQGPVSSVCRIPRQGHLTRELGGALVCISGTSFFVSQLEDEAHMVPRSMPVRGTPNRLIYSEPLRATFVACLESHVFNPSADDSRPARYAQSYIRMYRDRPGSATTPLTAEFALSPNARVNALTTCTLVANGKKYVNILVGTMEGDGSSGATIWLQRSVENGKTTLEMKKKLPVPEPVTAVASYGESNFLVICFGYILRLCQYNEEKKKIHVAGECRLHSMGLYITTEEPFIYVSTENDSLLIYRVEHRMDTSATYPMQLELMFTDREARHTLFHLPLHISSPSEQGKTAWDAANYSFSFSSYHLSSVPGRRQRAKPGPPSNHVLVADKDGSLALLYLARRQTLQTAAPTLLKASLPRSIMRLGRGLARPWFGNHTSQSQAATFAKRVLVNDIVGAASDGTLFGFSIVDEKTWRLLRFLQNLCSKSDEEKLAERPGGALVSMPKLRPSPRLATVSRTFPDAQDVTNSGVAPPARGLLEEGVDDYYAAEYGEFGLDMDLDSLGSLDTDSSSSATPTPQNCDGMVLLHALDPIKDTMTHNGLFAYHIDGDMLMRFTDKGGEGILGAMLDAVCSDINAGTRAQIRRTLCSYARDALSHDDFSARMDIDGAVEDDDELDKVLHSIVGWLRHILAPIL